MNNKTILIISPQKWGDMKLSKHHYAQELAKYNKVYFLNPPNVGFFNIQVTSNPNVNNLTIIEYSDWKLRSFKNRLDWVYNLGFNVLFKKILDSVDNKIDIVINFDNGVYFRYIECTKDIINIFFPVDKLIDTKINEFCVDIAFSISQNILDEINLSPEKKHLLNHGLSEEFYKNAQSLLNGEFQEKTSSLYNVAYVGNVLVDSLDRDLLMQLVINNKNVKFHLFGNISHSYRINSSTNSLSSKDETFVKQLKACSNVILYGSMAPSELITHLNKMDIFLLLYRASKGYIMDNSHKLIEYLSFGRPIVSTYLSHYKNSSLFLMCDTENKRTPEILFEDVVKNYEKYYTKNDFRARINFAIDNTYKNHLETISQLIKKIRGS